MTDALLTNIAQENEQPRYGLQLDALGNVVMDDDFFTTAITTSLWTWARLDDSEIGSDSERGGFWAASVSGPEGDNWGSKLRLLKRAKDTRENRALAKEYAEEALKWLLDDSLANRITVEVLTPWRDFLAWNIHIDGRQYRADRTGTVRIV